MFEITSEASFSAAHKLRNYNGNCEKLHGHNWQVKATVRCKELNDIGLGIDFRVLKSILKKIMNELDHSDLNVLFDKKNENPSSENIAKYIYKKIDDNLEDDNTKVWRVEVFETPGNCAAYFEYA